MPEPTEERLGRLERELAGVERRYRRLLIAVAGVAVAGLTLAWTWTATTDAGQEVIRANGFLLEDENGNPRADLFVSEGGPNLRMRNSDGEVQIVLALVERVPSLLLWGANGRLGAQLTVKEAPGLQLYDDRGEPRILLVVGEDGPTLGLADENGVGRAMLGAGYGAAPDARRTTYPESSLRLFGPDGNVIWSAPR